MKRLFLVVPLLFAISGCTVGPDYKRPQVAVPAAHRGTSDAAPASVSLADTKWDALFGDETLNQLIRTSLEKSFDARIAAERVQQARAQLGIVRGNLYPSVDLQAQFSASKQSTLGSLRFLPAGTNLSASFTQLGAALSWEIDLWGRLRRLTEAARARYLASEEGRNAVEVSLVSDVMDSYFQLLEQDSELDISRKTEAAAHESLRIVELRHQQGAA